MSNVFPGAIFSQSPYFGYPYMGDQRRTRATILGVIHITDGTSVPQPGPGKSWTFSVDRDGSIYQFLDPVKQAPWTNGDVDHPDTGNPLIVAATTRQGYNVNEFCFVTIENLGAITALGQLITSEQIAANNRILRWASGLSGLPMDRRHVIGHYQINSVSRQRCPTLPTDRDRVFSGILSTKLPDTAMEVAMKWKPVMEDWTTGIGEIGGAFYLDGPGVGERKWFTEPERVTSIAESTDGKWRQIAYGAEVLFMLRANLTPIPGTRNPAAPDYGAPVFGGTQELEDARLALEGIKTKVAAFAADIADD